MTTAAKKLALHSAYIDANGRDLSSMALLEQHTANNSATLDFTSWYSSTYDEYMIEFVNIVPSTNNVGAALRCSTDGGSSYDAASNYTAELFYMYSGGTGQDGNNSGSAAAMYVAGSVGNDANYGMSGSIKLFSPNSNKYKMIAGHTTFSHQSLGFPFMEVLSGSYKSASVVNAFRFLFSSGNITSGTIRIYGVPIADPRIPVYSPGIQISMYNLFK
jgi:hypothetical protein